MAFIETVAPSGSSGLDLDLVVSEHVISQKSTQTKYTIQFSRSISSGDYLLFRFRWPDNDTDKRYSTRIMRYNSSGVSYAVASQYTSSGAPVTLNCTISSNYLTLDSYSGSFQNIYAEIYDATPLFT